MVLQIVPIYKIYFCALLLCSSVTLADQASADERPSPLNEDFNKFVQQNLDYWHVPGISIAVVDNNETFSRVKPYKNPSNPETL